jgi:type IV pilus assembly protein PilX
MAALMIAAAHRRVLARQQGAVLVTVLAILLALMVVGVASARMSVDDERSARYERDRQLAFHTAEAAQHDALVNLGAIACAPAAPSDPPVWLSYDLGAAISCMQYGMLSDAVMASGAGALPASLPGIVVEQIPVPPGAVPGDYFRITSVGFGSRASSYVVLQSIVRVTTGGKKTRLSWREVGNWREQHDALN